MSHRSLTPAEAERLEMLAEECAEVIQVVTKVLRHGYESYHPESPNVSNRRLLVRELTDLTVVAGTMTREGDIGGPPSFEEAIQVWRRKLRYTHHQEVALSAEERNS